MTLGYTAQRRQCLQPVLDPWKRSYRTDTLYSSGSWLRGGSAPSQIREQLLLSTPFCNCECIPSIRILINSVTAFYSLTWIYRNRLSPEITAIPDYILSTTFTKWRVPTCVFVQNLYRLPLFIMCNISMPLKVSSHRLTHWKGIKVIKARKWIMQKQSFSITKQKTNKSPGMTA